MALAFPMSAAVQPQPKPVVKALKKRRLVTKGHCRANTKLS